MSMCNSIRTGDLLPTIRGFNWSLACLYNPNQQDGDVYVEIEKQLGLNTNYTSIHD